MKRVNFRLFALAIALVATSCVKDVVVDSNFHGTPSEKICFGAELKDTGEDTRGGVVSNRVGKHDLKSADGEFVLPMGVYVEDGIGCADAAETRGALFTNAGAINEFTVWAKHKVGDNVSAYFNEVVYKKDTTDNNIFKSTGEEYMWPGDGDLTFVAVTNAPESGFDPIYTAGSDKKDMLESFTYTVPADATKQNDIVLAKATCVGNLDASAPLKFEHIMSAVNFKVGRIVEGEIRKIQVQGIYNKATYNIEQNVWVLDKASNGNFDVVVADGVFETNTSLDAGTPINTADATFMMIPQTLPAGAQILVEFYEKTSSGQFIEHELTASIADESWDMSCTTNYTISIDESFNIEIVPTGKTLDAHYIISTVNVDVELPSDISNKNWTLTAEIEGGIGEAVTLYPETTDYVTDTYANHTIEKRMIENGYWCDKYVNRSGQNGIYTYSPTTTSARGTSTINGTGNVTGKKIYVLIPENNATYDRNIKLTLTSKGNTNVTKSIVMKQRCPRWTGDTTDDYGWETVDDNENDKFGFLFTRKVDYVFAYSFALSYNIEIGMTKDQAKEYVSTNIMKPYAPSTEGFYSFVNYNHSWSKPRFLVRLDYTVLNDIKGANSDKDGLANTLVLYDLAGKAGSIETIMSNTPKTFENKPNEFTLRTKSTDDPSDVLAPSGGEVAEEVAGVLDYILKKNKYYLYKSTETVDFAAPVFLSSDDIKWYIPADGQFKASFEPNLNIEDDSADDYWSSHVGTYDATDVTKSTAYNGNGDAIERKNVRGIIAVRKRDGDTKIATATISEIDTEEMAGGENGEAQWVE